MAADRRRWCFVEHTENLYLSDRSIRSGSEITVDTDFLWETGQHQWADRRTLLPSIPSFPIISRVSGFDIQTNETCVAHFPVKSFSSAILNNLLRDVPNP